MAITYTNSYYNSESKIVSEKVTIAVGATLSVRTGSIQVMSDIWETTKFATYWDDQAGMINEKPYVEQAEVDATPEVLEKVKAYLFKDAFNIAKLQAMNYAAAIYKGSVVKVVNGRTAKGTVGKVVAMIQRPYQMGWKSTTQTKYGIATSEEKIKVAAANGKVYENYKDMVWVWARNCELENVPEIDLEEVKERAAAIAADKFKNAYRKIA